MLYFLKDASKRYKGSWGYFPRQTIQATTLQMSTVPGQLLLRAHPVKWWLYLSTLISKKVKTIDAGMQMMINDLH